MINYKISGFLSYLINELIITLIGNLSENICL
jgi:hypothetical protein